MVSRISPSPAGRSPAPSTFCPSWCVIGHGVFLGDEDWLHMGTPVVVPGGVTVRICMSVDPATSREDGPYIVTDDEEWTAAQVREVGRSLIALADDLERLTSP